MLVLTALEAVEVRMPSTGNSCLLHALCYNGAPSGSNREPSTILKVRKDIASFVLSHHSTEINGIPLGEWVKDVSGLEVKEWATRFAKTGTMSDQIVLTVWPMMNGEAVYVWQLCREGYCLLPSGIFSHVAEKAGADRIRHVVYRAEMLHYNALQVTRPDALNRPAVPVPGRVSRARPIPPMPELKLKLERPDASSNSQARCQSLPDANRYTMPISTRCQSPLLLTKCTLKCPANSVRPLRLARRCNCSRGRSRRRTANCVSPCSLADESTIM